MRSLEPSRRGVAIGLAAAAAPGAAHAGAPAPKRPRAIAMWDFSWLERRWPGGGYEDWSRALDELVERGYDAVRIDAFPHLVAAGAERSWRLRPWGDQPWGAPGPVVVQVMPALAQFVELCAEKGVAVGLSTWFRQDDTNARLRLTTPAAMADAWIAALQALEARGLLKAVLYVDLCNEWPAALWAPFLTPKHGWGQWPEPHAQAFMAKALDRVRAAYPDLPLCFSTERHEVEAYLRHDVSRLDLCEHHVWMIDQSNAAFKKRVHADAHTKDGYFAELAIDGEREYRRHQGYWDGLLQAKIARLASVSRALRKPLATTEGWAVVSYRDWPGLSWGWVKDSCEVGVRAAAASGRFAAICTSNFCGPQSVGMWRDVAWHRRMTDLIKRDPIAPDLRSGRLYARL